MREKLKSAQREKLTGERRNDPAVGEAGRFPGRPAVPSGAQDPAVRVVLGHFLFVHVHPYPDGNGRIGRFLMNFLLTAAGYPWTVIPVERRDTYMAALEEPSVRQDIGPFTDLLAGLVGDG